MFGGPPVPDTDKPTEDREAVGSYALAHEIAAIGERLFATPGQIVELDLICPACKDARLQGKANRYTRSIQVNCPNCTFTISR